MVYRPQWSCLLLQSFLLLNNLGEKMPHGYTVGEFVNSRFNGMKFARIVVTIGPRFGSLIEIIINLKGTSLVISTVFGMNQLTVATIAIAIVLVYSNDRRLMGIHVYFNTHNSIHHRSGFDCNRICSRTFRWIGTSVGRKWLVEVKSYFL